MALYVEAAPGDVIKIGASTVTIVKKSGARTRMRVDSNLDVDHIKAPDVKFDQPMFHRNPVPTMK